MENRTCYPCNLSQLRNLDDKTFKWVQDIIGLHFNTRRTNELHDFIKDGNKYFKQIIKIYK